MQLMGIRFDTNSLQVGYMRGIRLNMIKWEIVNNDKFKSPENIVFNVFERRCH